MTRFLHENDLTGMKYAILTSSRHESIIQAISKRLKIPPQKLRLYLIENFDMVSLENLPTHYQAGINDKTPVSRVAHEIGYRFFVLHIPLYRKEQMEGIIRSVEMSIAAGTSIEKAINDGLSQLREIFGK